MHAPRLSDKDAQDPKLLRDFINKLVEQNVDLLGQVTELRHAMLAQQGIRDSARDRTLIRALAIGGTENVLPGSPTVIPGVDALPPTPTATTGYVVRLSTDGKIYRFDGSGWVELTGAPANMMTTDTAQDVTGTKTFKVQQIFDLAGLALLVKPASAPAGSTVIFQLQAATGANIMKVTYAGDLTLDNHATIGGDTIMDGGLLVRSPTYGIKIQPSSAPAANELLFELLSSGGATRMSVDEDGDIVCVKLDASGNLTANGAAITVSLGETVNMKGIITLLLGAELNLDDSVGNQYFKLYPADGTGANAYFLLGGVTVQVGTGSPEGVITAPVGSIWLRTNGGAGTTLYVKESGTGNTGWVGK